MPSGFAVVLRSSALTRGLSHTPNDISVEFFQNSVLRGTIPIMLPRTHGWHEEKHVSQLAELARVLVRLDHVAGGIVNANHCLM